MSLRAALSQGEIESRLRELPRWQYSANALERVYEGESYLQALDKLMTIAHLSEAADHHPDLNLAWKKLTVRYWTHTVKGVTELDFQMAHKAERILEP